MGFTLMAALAVLPKGSEVVVAEISPAVVEWNRTLFGEAQAAALRDPMTRIHVGDVAALVRDQSAAFDAILLDVDNSPHAMTRPANGALYAPEGLAVAKRALRPRGCFAVWSCSQHPDFAKRLERAGFEVEVHGVRARGRKGGAAHTIYLGRLPAAR
jgi:spermidine synthase